MNTDNIINESKARFEHAVNKRILKEKYQAKMLFAFNGGMWKADPELITLLEACLSNNEIVLLDLYENPIKVNPNELKILALSRWQEQMNAWIVEYQESKKKR